MGRMINNKLISIGSHAKVGKDTFYDLFTEIIESTNNYKVVKLSIGDEIRLELNPITLANFGIDLFTCNEQIKERFRPLLVWWGEIRKFNNPSYWTNILDKRIKLYNQNVIFVSSDLRYLEEYSWNRKIGGITVHLDRYSVKNGKKEYVKPINKQEEEFSAKLKDLADYKVEWVTTTNIKERKRYVYEFIEWLRNTKYI